MSRVAVRETQASAQLTKEQSATLIKNLLMANMSLVLKERGLFPDESYYSSKAGVHFFRGPSGTPGSQTDTDAGKFAQWLNAVAGESLKKGGVKRVILSITDNDPKAQSPPIVRERYVFSAKIPSKEADGRFVLTRITGARDASSQLSATQDSRIELSVLEDPKLLLEKLQGVNTEIQSFMSLLTPLPPARGIIIALVLDGDVPKTMPEGFFQPTEEWMRGLEAIEEPVDLRSDMISTPYHTVQIVAQAAHNAFDGAADAMTEAETKSVADVHPIAAEFAQGATEAELAVAIHLLSSKAGPFTVESISRELKLTRDNVAVALGSPNLSKLATCRRGRYQLSEALEDAEKDKLVADLQRITPKREEEDTPPSAKRARRT